MSKWIVDDITGKKFGMLTAVKFIEDNVKLTKWEFLCDCGNLVIRYSANVKYTASKNKNPNCGCKSLRIHGKLRLTHGMSFHPAYNSWAGIKKRCLNELEPAFHNYGGRGIKICDRWLESFENFWSDMGSTWKEGLSIDRIDNNGNYEPTNCRWATDKEQNENRRNRHIISTPNGDMSISEAVEFSGINRAAIRTRIKYGWSADRLFDPIKVHKKYKSSKK